MKQLNNSFKYLLFSIAFLFGQIALNAQVNVIGSTGADGPYTTLGAAFTAINAGAQTGNNITIGLTGNTTELATATLNAGAWTLITIAPALPVTITGNIAGAIIKLNGADNVIIDGRISSSGRNITVTNSSISTASAAIWLSSTGVGAGSTNNIIRSLNLSCGVDVNASTSTSFGIISSGLTITNTATSGGNDNDNNQYIDNSITKCRYGIFINGVTGNLDNTSVISDNIVGPAAFGLNNIGKVGIYLGFQNAATVTRNTIQNVGVSVTMGAGGADRIGIAVGSEAWASTPGIGSITNSSITRNLVHDIIEEKTFSSVGILLSAGTVASANTVCSNMIYNVRADGTSGDDCVGLGVGSGNGDFIVNNTVSITGDMDPGTSTSLSQTPCAFRIGGTSTTNISVLNNIFYVDVTSNSNMNAVCIQLPSTAFAFGTGGLNYNDYYFPASNTFMSTGAVGTGSLATTFYATLANWQAALTPVRDANSIQLDPSFISSSDLHIALSSINVNNVGTPVACAIDFDGDPRSVTTPDIGADEFTPVSCSTANGGTISPSSFNVCAGSTQILSSTGFTVGAGTTYQWAVSNTPGGPYSNVVGGTGATTTTYTTAALTAGTYYYIMQVNCSFGSLSGQSNEVTVVVNALPTIAVTPTTASICMPGGSAVALTATGGLGYTWAPPAGLSATTGASVNALPAATTTYTVVGVDINGCTASATTAITVSEGPSMSSVTATPPSVCSGGTSQLLTSAGTTSAYTVSNIPFAAVPTPGSGVTTLANAGVAVTALTSGTLDDGGWASQPIPFNFNYFGTGFTSFAVSTNGFIWLGTGAPTTFTGYNNIFPSTFSQTNTIGACYSDLDFRTVGTINYFVTGTAPYRALVVNWSNGNFFSATGAITTQVIIYESSNVIEVHTTNSTGTNNAVEGIQNAAGTTAYTVVGRNNVLWTVAIPDGYRWSPSGGPVTYSWSPATFLSSTTINNPIATGVTATTTYTVTATAGTCSSTGTVTITAGSALTATGNATPSSNVCIGSTFTLNALPSGGGAPYTYSWTGPNSFTSTNQNPVISGATLLNSGTYTVVITDNCAATFTVNVTVTVNPLPTVAVTPTAASICLPGGSPVSLTASGATTFAWLPATGLSATTGSTVTANPSASTSFTVTGTDANGCANTATTAITIASAVIVDSIIATPSNICSGGNSVLAAYGSTASGTYCQPTYTNGTAFGDYISQVTLGTINNATVGSASPFYTLYPTSGSTTTTLTAGSTYTITMAPGTYTDNDIAAFIDYDKNGVLNNAGEKLGETDGIGAAPASTSFTFTVPLTAFNGTTRLRVREMDHGGTNDIDPCTAQSTFGEVEDYTITIVGGVNAISSVTWSPATFLSSTTGTPVNATAVTATTTYTATLTSGSGCVGTGTVTLTSGSPLTATAAAAPATTICAGTNVTLSATTAGGGAPFTYSWTGPNSFTSASQNPVLSSITTAATGTYTCVISDNCASTFTVNVTLTVNPLPTVSVTPTSATFCSLGGPVTLTASGTATTYAWLPATYLSATTGTVVDATPAVTTTYTVTGTDGVGCASTATTTIAYSESPSIGSVTVTPSTICAGSNSQLNSSVGTTAAYTLSPTTFALQPCQVTAGPTGDDNVVNAPIGFTFTYYGVSYTSLGISTNGNVQLGDGSGTANNPTYNNAWTDVAIPNAGTPNNMIDLAWDDWFINAGEITYGVTGSAPNRKMIICYNTTGRGSGSADTLNGQIVLSETSNSILLNMVKKGLQPANTATQGIENLTGTAGSIFVPTRNNQAWTANNNSVMFTPSGGTITYAWSPATFLSSTTISNPAINAATATTTYTLTATSAGCSSTGTATLTVNSLPIVSLSGANQFCAGDSTLLTGSGGGTSQWYLNGVAIVGATTNTHYATVAGVYNMTKTNLNGCTDSSAVGITVTINALPTVTASASATSVCIGSSVTLTGVGNATSYSWSAGQTNAVPFTATTTTNYTVTGTDANGCSAIDSVLVTVNPLPVVALGADITQCGGSVTLDAANAGSTFLWSDASTNQTLSVTTTGTYSVTVTDGNGCSASDAIDVTINALPIVSLGNDTTTCAGALVLDAGNVGSTYLWSDNSTAQTLNVNSTNTYSVVVTDANGCSSSDVINITVNTVPVVSLGADVTQCGGTVTLDAQNVGDTYLWNDNSTNQTLVASTSGIYFVDVTNATGCTTRDSITVTINANPVVNLGLDTAACGSITLDAGNAGATYLWSDNTTNQTLTATSSATYSVTVTDANGCVGSDAVSVTVNTPPTVTFSIIQTSICVDDAALTLTGSPAGGTFGGAFVIGSTFDPSAATAGTYPVTYTYTDVNGCSASATDSIAVSNCTVVVEAGVDVSNVFIYPNPNNGQFTIELNGVPTSPVMVTINDALGQKVQSFTMTGTTTQVDLSVFASGVYMVHITDGANAHVYRVVSNK